MEIICYWRREQDRRERRAVIHAGVFAVFAAVVIVLVFWK